MLKKLTENKKNDEMKAEITTASFSCWGHCEKLCGTGYDFTIHSGTDPFYE